MAHEAAGQVRRRVPGRGHPADCVRHAGGRRLIAVPNVLVVSDKMSDELAGKLVKLIFDEQKELVKVHPEAANISIQNAADTGDIELHPGAKKALADLGAPGADRFGRSFRRYNAGKIAQRRVGGCAGDNRRPVGGSAPERLSRWIDGFAERHGPFTTSAAPDAVTVTAEDGAVAVFHPPFPPLPSGGPALSADRARPHRPAGRRAACPAGRLRGGRLRRRA